MSELLLLIAGNRTVTKS